jgi:hypothetical protein
MEKINFYSGIAKTLKKTEKSFQHGFQRKKIRLISSKAGQKIIMDHLQQLKHFQLNIFLHILLQQIGMMNNWRSL